MPQASPELQEQMRQRFGDAISEEGPTKYLQDAGYKLTRHWFWEPKPGITQYREMTCDEFDCLLFLVHEWDYGGLTTEVKK